jgi:hypothetical protein
MAADAEQRRQRFMGFELALEPFGPLGYTRKAVNVRQSGPHGHLPRIGQQSSSIGGWMVRELL